MITPSKRASRVERIKDPYKNRGDCLRLEKNERNFNFSKNFITSLQKKITSQTLNQYPELDPLYNALADSLDVSKNQLYLGSGSEQCIKAVYETYLDPGDRMLVHKPSYAMYPVYADFFQTEVVFQEFESDFSLNLTDYKSKIPGCKLVILENPSGSTGTAYTLDQLEALIQEAQKNNALAVIDEVYYHLNDITALSLIEKYDNLVVIRSFSKVFGAAGARVGFIVSNAKVIENIFKARPMYEISHLSCVAALHLLEHKEEMRNYINKVNHSKQFLIDEFVKRNIQTQATKTNFILVKLPTHVNFAEQLKKEQILIPGVFEKGCLAGWSRITVGNKVQMKILLKMIDKMFV